MTALVTQSRRAPLVERKDDLYETPPEATHALLKAERLPHRLWEPAAGRGAIVSILRAAGHEVLASDLVDYGDPTHFARRDFLMEWKAPDGCEAIVTNPPFKLANEFVAHALHLGVPKVMMLLRLAFIETTRRSPILDEAPLARILVFKNRLPTMHRDGWQGSKTGSAIAFAWFCWDQSHQGPIEIRRISWERVP
jgi:hypothetical protein